MHVHDITYTYIYIYIYAHMYMRQTFQIVFFDLHIFTHNPFWVHRAVSGGQVPQIAPEAVAVAVVVGGWKLPPTAHIYIYIFFFRIPKKLTFGYTNVTYVTRWVASKKMINCSILGWNHPPGRVLQFKIIPGSSRLSFSTIVGCIHFV